MAATTHVFTNILTDGTVQSEIASIKTQGITFNFEEKVVILKRVSIPISYHTITTETFILNDNGVLRTVTMQPGSYNYVTFATMLQTAVRASGVAVPANYTVTANVDSGFITFTNTVTNIALNLAGQTNVARILGFTAVDGVLGATHTGVFPAQCFKNLIYLCSDRLVGHSTMINGYQRCIMLSIGVNVDAYSIMTVHSDSLGWSKLCSLNAPEVDFYFIDELGRVIDFNNGIWSIELEVC